MLAETWHALELTTEDSDLNFSESPTDESEPEELRVKMDKGSMTTTSRQWPGARLILRVRLRQLAPAQGGRRSAYGQLETCIWRAVAYRLSAGVVSDFSLFCLSHFYRITSKSSFPYLSVFTTDGQ